MPVNREQFKAAAAKRRKTKDVDVSEFPEFAECGTIRLRALSAWDLVQFQNDVTKAEADGKSTEEAAFGALAKSWVGEDNSLLFPEAEGVTEAQSLDPKLYEKLTKDLLILNGLSAEAVEDAAKN